MRGNMKEIIVFVLLMLASLSDAKPLQRSRRAIVKDYFNPLLYPTDKLQFEKGEDGKYRQQKTADSVLSRVEYAVAKGIDASNDISGESPGDVVNAGNQSPASELEFQKELSTKESTPGVPVPDAETKPESVSKKEHPSSAKLDIPVDSKWTLIPKPNGKDDEGGEEYFPEPPVVPEEREDEGKVEIGDIPKHPPLFFPPSSIPMFFPGKISFRILSLLPKPPAIGVSDRLPDPEVIEESSETAVVENISPGGPAVIKEGKRFVANRFINPLRIGLQLPFLPPAHLLKEAVDDEKEKGLVKSKIVNIGGHKMLLQKKILMSPHHDTSQVHFSVMSLQPLEEVDPKILKELDIEKEELEKDLELEEKKEAEKRSLKEEEVDSTVKETGKEVFSKLPTEPEILDAEKAVVAKIPPPEVSVPELHAIEDGKKVQKESEFEAKIEDEAATIKSHSTEESRLKKEMQTEGKLEDEEKDKSLEILSIVPEEEKREEEEETSVAVKKEKDLFFVPEEEKTTAVVKAETDVLIGTEDLLKFRSQIKTQNPAKKGDDEFEKGSETKVEEEMAESRSVEVMLKPGRESRPSIEEAITKGKKGDEGMLLGEEIATSHEFTKSENPEKAVIVGVKDEDEKINVKDAVASHSEREMIAKKDAKVEIDEMKIKSKKESENKQKKGDDDAATDVIASKEVKEKTDLQYSEENSSTIEDLALTKTEGAILEDRKKKFDGRKDKVPSKKKKCKCEDSDESDSDDEDDID